MAKGKFRNYNFSDRRTEVTTKESEEDIIDLETSEQPEEPVVAVEDTVEEQVAVSEEVASEEVSEPVVELPIVEPVVPTTPVVKHEPHLVTLLKGLKMKLAGLIEHTGAGKTEEPVTGASRRYSVYKHVKEILNISDPAEFKKQMNVFHNLIKEGYGDVFNEKNLFKFPNEWPGTSHEFQEYRKILQLLIETRTPEGLKHFGERLDLDKFGLKLSQKERQNLVSYLNI